MWQKSRIFLVLLITMNFHQVVNSSTTGIVLLMKSSRDLYKEAIKINQVIQNSTSKSPDVEIYKLITDDLDDSTDMMISLNYLFSQFEKMVMHVETVDEAIAEFPRVLANSLLKIKNFYKEARRYSKDASEQDSVDPQDLMRKLTGRQDGNLQDNLSKMSGLENFLKMFTHHIQAKGNTLCGYQSANLYVYDLYKAVIAAELMGQIAESFGYYLKAKLNRVDVHSELQRAQEDRQNRLRSYFVQFKKYLGEISTSLRPCDPMNLIRNVTFIELERLYKNVIVPDYGLIHEQSCRGSCEEIDRHNYKGRGFNCRHLHSCGVFRIFHSCNLRHPSPRLYEFVEDVARTRYGGDTHQCNGFIEKAGPDCIDESFYECEHCKCVCEGFTRSSFESPDEAVSLLMSRANTNNNMVVTGLRFARKGAIICIELKQGKLLAGGDIKEGSEYWSSCTVPELQTDLNDINYVRVHLYSGLINLDDLIVPVNHVVTGATIGLGPRGIGNERRMELKLEYMEFNFATGKLTSPGKVLSPRRRSSYGNFINGIDFKNPLQLETPRDPAIVEVRSDAHINFWMSDFKTDAGQTTLPLFEAIKVESEPSAPLSGVGLFYKATPGYGGFMSLRIYTLNYGEYMGSLHTVDQLLTNNSS